MALRFRLSRLPSCLKRLSKETKTMDKSRGDTKTPKFNNYQSENSSSNYKMNFDLGTFKEMATSQKFGGGEESMDNESYADIKQECNNLKRTL